MHKPHNIFRCKFRVAIAILYGMLSIVQTPAQYPVRDIQDIRKKILYAGSDTVIARLNAMLGWELRFTDQNEAERLAQQVITIALKSNNNLLLAEAYRIIGFIKINNQELEAGLRMYDYSTLFAEKAKSGYYRASIQNLTANMYHDRGDFDKSILHYSKGLKIAENTHEHEMVAMLSNNLAEAYADAGRPFSFTEPFYEKALTEVIKTENWQFAGMIYSNIAKEKLRTGNKTAAIAAIQKSLENLNKKKDRAFVYASTITDIGETLSELGKYKEAETFLLDAITIFDSLHRKDKILAPLSVLGDLNIKTARLNIAESYAKTLLNKATDLHSKIFVRNANRQLSDIALKKGKPVMALAYFEKYKNWNDSIFNENREKTITNAESLMKLERQTLENELLKKNNKYLFNSIVLVIITALLLLIAGVLLVKGYRNVQKKNRLLHLQNEVIKKKSAEKDILIREIHHRVKNNLQVVSSLLNLKANSITDIKAVEALRDSHQKVRAIALIHQKLYGFESLNAIPLREYILQLFSDMRILYKGNHIQLTCITQPADLQLDLESAVPLGLILNEAITNAMKHAFVKRDAGRIRIECVKNQDGFVRITVADDGEGFPDDFDPNNSTSLGFRIIRELTRQLKGSLTHKTLGAGASFTVLFPNGNRYIPG